MIIIFLLLITGCSVNYNLVINEDLTILEETKLTGTKDFFANYYKTTKTNVLKSYLDIYGETLDENDYKYELVKEDTPYVEVKKTYNNVSDFTKKSIFLGDYFDEVKYSEDGNIKKIETSGYLKGSPDNNDDKFYLSNFEVSINCPYKVTNHNAKKVDKATNTYYYELNDGSKIVFEYDISSKYNPNSDSIQIVILCLIAIMIIWIIIFIVNKRNKSML